MIPNFMLTTIGVMAITTHSARITGPLLFVAADGSQAKIPIGPCLVEQVDDAVIDVIWGARGQRSAGLPAATVRAAQDNGTLVLLD